MTHLANGQMKARLENNVGIIQETDRTPLAMVIIGFFYRKARLQSVNNKAKDAYRIGI